MKKITFIRFLSFLMLLFSTTIGFSQTIISPTTTETGGTSCEASSPSLNCTSSSAKIRGAFIGTSTGARVTNCSQTGPFFIYIDVEETGNKSALLVQFDLSINGGTSVFKTFKYNGNIETAFYKTMEIVGWNCGDEIELKNVFVSWDNNDSNGNPICPTGNYSHCNGAIPNITVDAPLVTNFSYTRNCNNVIVTTDITGGKLYTISNDGLVPIQTPYTLKINYGDGTGDFTISPSPDLYDDINQEFDDYVFSSHSFPVNNTANPIIYTITLTATDTATPTPASSVKTHTVTIYPQLAGLTLTPSPTSCNGSPGSITASGVTGGNGSYSYSIDNGANYQASATFNGLPNGTYTIIAKDTNGCTTTQAVTISQPDAALTASISSQTDVNCFGDLTGTVTVAGANGTAPYTYAIDGATFGNSGTFGTLAAGDYTVTVKDTNGCTTTQAVTISQPDALTASVAKTNVTCNGANDGTITVTAPAGGYGTYEYRLDSGTWQTSGNFTALANATYSVQIRDAANTACVITLGNQEITQPDALTASVAKTNVTCNGANDGTITVTAPAGGYGTYEYRLDSGTWQTSGNFTALANATYSVQIRDAANTACVITLGNQEITQPDALTASVAKTNVTCNGANDGTITVTAPAGGYGTYEYRLDSGTWQTSGNFTALANATYSVQIRDAANTACVITLGNQEITQPDALTASVAKTNVTCNGANDGTITVTAPAGGYGTYEYRLDSGTWQTSGNFTALANATYSVQIRDAANTACVITLGNQEITQPDALTASVAKTNVTCNGANDGTITVTAPAGGYGTYEYRLDSGTWQTSGNFTALANATYSVQIRDAANTACVITLGNQEITQPDALTASVAKTNVTCNGANDGTITVTAPAGGYGTYEYRLDSGTWQTSGNFTALANATYSVQIRDAANTACVITLGNQEITQPDALTASVAKTNVTCNGANDGTITVTAPAGGYGTYEYRLDSGTWQTSGNFTALANATYSVQIRDAANTACVITLGNQEITQPDALTASVAKTNVTCNGANDGTITVTAPAGGYGTYEYRLDSGTWQTSGNFTALANATYSVQIRDAANTACVITLGNQEITQPAVTVSVSGIATNATCFGEANGSIAVTNSEGSTVVITNANNEVVSNTNLPAGTYTLTASATNGNANGFCTATAQVTITQPAVTVSVSGIATNATCFGEANGSIAVTNSEGSTVVITNANNEVVSNTNLPAGTYTLTASAPNGNANGFCTATAQVTITQPAVTVSVSGIATNATCFGEANGSIAVTNSEGSTVVITNANNEVVSNTNLPAGTYTLTASATNGNANGFCTATAQVTITQPAVTVSVSGIATNATCFGEANGSIAVTNSEGSTVVITNANNEVVSNTNLPAGTYTLTASAPNGNANGFCTATAQVTITQPAVTVSVSGIATNATCFGEANGSIAVTNSEGSTVVITNANNEVVSNTNLPAGTYTLTASATNGNANGFCTATAQVTITQPAVTVSVSGIATNATCFGEANGSIAVTNSEGSTVVITNANNEVVSNTNLPAGTYTLTASATNGNANGFCTATAQVTITQPAVTVSVSGIATNATCFGEANGSIAVTNSEGSTVVITNANNEVVSNTNLPAGTYTLTASATNGNANGFCTATAQVTITQPAVTVSVSGIATNATCFGEANGSIAVTNSEGSTVVITNANNEVVSNTNLPAGTYTLTASATNGNANGFCTATAQVTITQPAVTVSVSGIATNATCFGEANGSIAVTNSEGSTVVITNANNEVVSNTNLPAGTYTLTASATNGNANGFCTATAQVTITQPAVTVSVSGIATNATCFGEANGSIAVTNSEGSTVVITNANNEVVSNTNLPAGTYTLTASATNGNANGFCTATAQVTITQPAVTVSVSGIATNATCFGEANGSIAVTNSEGSTVVITNANNEVVSNTNLPAGTYTLTASATNGNANGFCTATAQVTITQPAATLSATAIIINNNNCIGCSNGAINITPQGGTAPYLFSWSNGAITEDISSLPKGKYDLEIKDANGCIANYTYFINESGIEILKDANYVDSNNDGKTNIGDTIVYSFIVKNTGNVTLTNVTVTDNNAIITGGPIASLEAGASNSTTFIGTHAIIQEDINKGVYYNIALSNAKDPENVTVTDTSSDPTPCTSCPVNPECTDCTITELNQSPSISITKDGTYVDTNQDGKTNVGDQITYAFVVKNTGNVTLTNVTVTDNNATVTGGPIATMAPGATDATTFTAIHTITLEDINAGIVYNLATATAKDPKNNPVTATSTDPTPCTTCPKDPECTTCTITEVPQNPGISITKDGTYVDTNQDGKTNVGDQITYAFVVKNTGNVTLTNVTVTDNNATVTGGPIATMAPGATDATTFTATHAITQEDINKGIVYNLATATAKDPKDKLVTATSTDPTPCTTCPKDPECTTCTITEVPQNPGISITKDGTYVDTNQDGKTNVGDQITYAFVVKNTGNVTLTNVTVTDNNATVTGGPIATMAPGATDATTFTAIHTITLEDINAGIVYNLATATAKDPKNNPVTATSTDPTPCTTCPKDPECTTCTITEVPQNPGISITKDGTYVDTNQDGKTNVGDQITYAFVVKNTGNVTLTNVTVTDNNATVTGGPIATLAPGATDVTTFTASHAITQEDINKGIVYNLATATAKDPKDNPLTATSTDPTPCTTCPKDPECTDCTITEVPQNPGISITKDGTYVDTNQDGKTNVGDVVSYNFVITNTGNVTLTNVMVTDNNAVVSGGPIASLAPGATNTTTFSASHTITQDDINKEFVYNLALATAKDPKDQAVTDTSSDPTPCTSCPKDPECTDCTITELNQSPSVVITKDGTYVDSNQDGKTNVGDVVSYNFVITNTGNVTLTNVMVTDNNAVVSGGPIASLAPGATNTTTFSASHTITQDDINKGVVYNLALATAKDPKGNNVTDTSSDPTPCTSCPVNPECTDCTITELNQSPSIALVKTASVGGNGSVGNVITYTFAVTNTGNTTLSNVVVTDPMVGLSITGNPIVTLEVGATSTAIKGTYTITQADIDTGNVTNSALAKAQDPKGNNVTDISGTTINNNTPTVTTLTQNSGLEVIKTSNTENYSSIGDIINYTIQVRNTGNVTLHAILVTDPLTGLNTTIETLAPGASQEFTENYTVIQADRENGSVTNTAFADGLTPNETQIHAEDTAVVEAAIVLGCGTILVHNAFTPNGDEFNDKFKIDNIDDTLCYPENSVEIYNRWGILVYETKGYDNGNNVFKGYSEGRVTVDKNAGLPTGTYFYILKYTAIGLQGESLAKQEQGYLYLSR